MESRRNQNPFERRSLSNPAPTSVKWSREWVPHDTLTSGGKCQLLRWVNEATLKALREKNVPEPEPEPNTEVLFLCTYDGCGKIFFEDGALKKHSHIHGERQHTCHYDNCGKKFVDLSKLKRHFLTHTGEKKYFCPHEGCGKTFALDFNLRSHMKIHSQENYHICPYPDCGKRYAHEDKLKNHIASRHEKNIVEPVKHSQPTEKPPKTTKPSAASRASAFANRPYTCPYEGCDKAYIHEYKLNLHLRREHPSHFKESVKTAQTTTSTYNDMDGANIQDAFDAKQITDEKRRRPKPNLKLPAAKVAHPKGNNPSPAANMTLVQKQWSVKEEVLEEDSEETEDECNNVAVDGWRYAENDEDDDDDEETEYED